MAMDAYSSLTNALCILPPNLIGTASVQHSYMRVYQEYSCSYVLHTAQSTNLVKSLYYLILIWNDASLVYHSMSYHFMKFYYPLNLFLWISSHLGQVIITLDLQALALSYWMCLGTFFQLILSSKDQLSFHQYMYDLL